MVVDPKQWDASDPAPWVQSALERRLQRYLPWSTYAPGSMLRRLVHVIASEFQSLRDAMTDAANQTFARQATWTLPQHEADWGLTPATTQTTAQRQDRLVSQQRILGTADIKKIKATAEAYQFGTIEVIPDFSAYVIVIQFMDARGIPANLPDMQAQVRARIPPAYDIQWRYRYNTYGDWKRNGYTYAQIKALGLTYAQMKTYALPRGV